MCKKAKAETAVLQDRTKGLDARGNRAMNTRAETSWATDTLKGIEGDPETVNLVTDELKRVYDESKTIKNPINKKMVGSFQKGFEDYFGEYKTDSKTNQLRLVKPAKAKAQPQDLVNLMLESKYDFKEAVDTLARVEKDTVVGKKLYKAGRGDVAEFNDRGRKEGRKRRDSFIGPHAGIADRDFRPDSADNFFTREVPHAKGMLEGDPESATYKRFVEQGAPFIGGVSGTIQGITMCWEAKGKLSDIDDDGERATEIARREKTVGVYMATLVAGGHHSMAEMLFAAQQHGLFDDVTSPLDNYPKAMSELGDRFAALGLAGGLSPKGGESWTKALAKVKVEIGRVRAEIVALWSSDPAGQQTILKAFDDNFTDEFDKVFGDDLAGVLDEITALVDDDDDDEREAKKKAAAILIDQARDTLDDDMVQGLEDNPFVPVSVRKELADVLDQVSSLVG